MSVPTHDHKDRSRVRYGVIRTPGNSHGMELPAPKRIPEVALDKIPAHAGPTRKSLDGKVRIVTMMDGDPVPEGLEGVDWLTLDDFRGHLRKNESKWREEG